ncbi:MAG: DUF5721 family protein [Lachnospiraceae bacterium]
MIALLITTVKEFMNQTLVGELFDHFLLSEASVTSKISYSIDGHLYLSHFSEPEKLRLIEEEVTLIPFHYVKRTIFDMMKGTQTPSFLKLVLQLSPKNIRNTLTSIDSRLTCEDIGGMCINLTFQNERLMCTTGISYTIFAKDKELEHEWDRLICRFLEQHNIVYEILA